MGTLLKKELKLTMHPTAPMFLALSALMLVPNYPYYITFFYNGMAVFFTCLSGRENQDVEFTLMLPVPKKDIVKGRYMYCVMLEILQIILCVPFAIIRQGFNMPGNQVGMDANIALFGFSMMMLGLFNVVFFGVYYRDVKKVGKAFILGSTADFLFMAVMETLTHIVPLFRDKLDTSDPEFLTEKMIVLILGIIIFILLTVFSYRNSVKSFEKQDI